MDARTTKLTAFAIAAATALLVAPAPARVTAAQRPSAPASSEAGPASRIVSLVPALTESLYAIGAGAGVVGVSSFDAFPPQVAQLPKVGALIDPNTERILALKPNLVITYGSQVELQTQLAKAGIRTFSYRHGGISTILQSIRDLGEATGRPREALTLARQIEERVASVRRRVSGRARPRTLLVFERQPKTLREVYVSGGEGFLHELLDAAGGANVFADVKRESVQPSQETLIARSPEVVLEVRAVGLIDPADVRDERAAWSALPSLAAVRNNRVYLLSGDYLVVPGPRLVQAVDAFARALHPDAFR